MKHEPFDPNNYARLIDVQLDLINQLSPEDRQRYLQAEPGSTRLHPLPFDGWYRITVNVGPDLLDLGDFHVDALAIDPTSVN